MYCGIVFIKVVRHSLDLILNSCKISAFLSYYETLSGMFLPCSKLRILSASYCFQSRLNWDGVLFAILYSFDTADCIRMSLTYAFSPECVILAVCQDCICIHAVQRKHSRIPAYRNNSNMTALRSCFVHICKMFWDSLMGIKAVYHIEPLGILRCLLRQISSTSAAKNHNINLVFHLLSIIYRIYLRCLCQNFNTFRSTTGKNSHQFHIRIVFDRTFYATSQVTISQDTNTNTHYLIPPILPHARCTIPTNGHAAPKSCIIPYERQMLHVCGIYIYFTL